MLHRKDTTNEKSANLLFIVLLFFSLYVVINSRSYNRHLFYHKLAQSTQWVHDVQSYFNLKQVNQYLFEENINLKNQIEQLKTKSQTNSKLSFFANNPFYFLSAKVIQNSYISKYNYFILNKGTNHEINKGMGVGNEKGILGIVSDVSKSTARVISLLNKNVSISAKLKKTNHFGSLTWDGKDYRYMKLTDIPQTAPSKIGDTIVTSGYSLIFPEGIEIGIIKDIETDYSENYQKIKVKLFNDLTNLSNAYIVIPPDQTEIRTLLNEIHK